LTLCAALGVGCTPGPLGLTGDGTTRHGDLAARDRSPDSTRRVDLLPPASEAATADAATDLPCVDPCPVPSGISWQCGKRFVYGTNFAWLHFGGDFGGIAAWGKSGVSSDSASYAAAMKEMKQGGVNVIRWWMFPRFWTEAISFDSDDAPSGIGGTLVADLLKALELAEQLDLRIMLTLFSFDNFAPTQTVVGIYTRGLQPMIVDAGRRQKLLQNLIAPVAKAVESSPFRKRMIAWDLCNEPEWAITGANLHGGAGFIPQSGLQAVTHAQMETFFKELAVTLRASSSALITVGGAAIKWGNAWTQVGVDFHQLHYFDWVYEWYPYKLVTLASVGLTGKPVLMGELPQQGLSAIPSKGLPAVSASQLAADLLAGGYAGLLSWAYNDSSFPWSAALQDFASQHPCEIHF
jgi:hypothetical protein